MTDYDRVLDLAIALGDLAREVRRHAAVTLEKATTHEEPPTITFMSLDEKPVGTLTAWQPVDPAWAAEQSK
jgi:hypothetical protein